eukprot:1159772-Pelagomonas_calceolata.AAC.2
MDASVKMCARMSRMNMRPYHRVCAHGENGRVTMVEHKPMLQGEQHSGEHARAFSAASVHTRGEQGRGTHTRHTGQMRQTYAYKAHKECKAKVCTGGTQGVQGKVCTQGAQGKLRKQGKHTHTRHTGQASTSSWHSHCTFSWTALHKHPVSTLDAPYHKTGTEAQGAPSRSKDWLFPTQRLPEIASSCCSLPPYAVLWVQSRSSGLIDQQEAFAIPPHSGLLAPRQAFVCAYACVRACANAIAFQACPEHPPPPTHTHTHAPVLPGATRSYPRRTWPALGSVLSQPFWGTSIREK